MSVHTIEVIILSTWVGLSILACLLSLWASWHGFVEARARSKEYKDSAKRGDHPADIALGRQQAFSGWLLFWVHVAFLLHQLLFLYIGVVSLENQNNESPREVARESRQTLEDTSLKEEIAAFGLIGAQGLIVGSQVLLVLNTSSQRKIRKIMWEYEINDKKSTRSNQK